MLDTLAPSIWLADARFPGPTAAISFGVHGDERPPIEAGMQLVAKLASDELVLSRGRLLLIHANPKASEQDRRWSEGGVDLNRCFSAAVLAKTPELYEESRAREIARVLVEVRPQTLVDFHCTVEPGDPFLMQHPAVDHAPSREVASLLSARVLLADPALNFGGVSLDEWMSTRGQVGICYETGWLKSPACTPEHVLADMLNLLAGLGMLTDRVALRHTDKEYLQLDHVVLCETPGFRWRAGIGENLQALPKGTVLGTYPDGREVALMMDATLIFPKKKPELVQIGKPLVYLGVKKK
jgi:succinylglutamate desuccinylase